MSESDDLGSLREQRRQELLENVNGDTDPAGRTAAAPGEPIHVNSRAELEELTGSHRVVLADFYADWCGPCKMLEPTVRELAQNTPAAVAKVDVDALPQLAQDMQVQGVPSLFLYVEGKPVKRLVGVQDYGTLESLVQQYAG